jgi:hypothetical protein
MVSKTCPELDLRNDSLAPNLVNAYKVWDRVVIARCLGPKC